MYLKYNQYKINKNTATISKQMLKKQSGHGWFGLEKNPFLGKNQ